MKKQGIKDYGVPMPPSSGRRGLLQPVFADAALSWTKVSPRGNLLPFAIQASRVLRQDECDKIAAWCKESIGDGFFMQQAGTPNGLGSMWIGDVNGTMHFRDETHMVIFVVAFTYGR